MRSSWFPGKKKRTEKGRKGRKVFKAENKMQKGRASQHSECTALGMVAVSSHGNRQRRCLALLKKKMELSLARTANHLVLPMRFLGVRTVGSKEKKTWQAI